MGGYEYEGMELKQMNQPTTGLKRVKCTEMVSPLLDRLEDNDGDKKRRRIARRGWEGTPCPSRRKGGQRQRSRRKRSTPSPPYSSPFGSRRGLEERVIVIISDNHTKKNC